MSLHKEAKSKIINDFKIGTDDSGSTAVQIALLTNRIRSLTEHLQGNKKDFSSKRGLLKMISQRNKFLKYIERVDEVQYKNIIKRLNLKG